MRQMKHPWYPCNPWSMDCFGISPLAHSQNARDPFNLIAPT